MLRAFALQIPEQYPLFVWLVSRLPDSRTVSRILMRRLFVRLSVCFALLASAVPNRALAAPADREKRAEKEAELKKKDNVAIDKSLAGDITRQKEEVGGAIPLQYDQFRIGVQLPFELGRICLG